MRIILATLILFLSACGSDPESSCVTDSCGLCPSEQTGVKICSFVATPTVSESVTLKNYGTSTANLNNWSLWDANALGNGSGQKNFGSSDTIAAGSTGTYGSLPFGINDTGETITLKNDSNATVHQRSN